MFEAIAFYFFMVLSIVAFLVVVSTRNILYALTALVSGMIFISSFFFLLGAEFLGVVQIAVYTGAVIVMYAFGLMFVDTMSEIRERHKGDLWLSVMIVCVALLLVALFVSPMLYESQQVAAERDMQIITGEPNTFTVGKMLFGHYLIAFEIAGVLLLVALIAGIALGIKGRNEAQDEASEVADISSFKPSFKQGDSL